MTRPPERPGRGGPDAGGPDELLPRLGHARTIFLLGESDVGKSTLAAGLAGVLAEREGPVAVVDADIGQSEIGPPTTVGLGRVRGRIGALADAELVALGWVGRTSPAGVEDLLVDATGDLVARARALGLARVLVDTSGLVRGWLGERLKRAKIRRVEPDLVVCLQRADECEPILAGLPPGRVLRLPASASVVPRSPEERRRRRERRLAAYLAPGRLVGVALERVVAPAGEPDLLPERLADRLAGLDDARGETVGIGRIQGVDARAGVVLIETPVPAGAIARVHPASAPAHPVRQEVTS